MAGPEKRRPPVKPAGERKTSKAAVLGAGASLLQDVTPTKQFDVYVVGLHCGKQDPARQMEAHHYCNQLNEDFIQCVLFDGNTEDANLIGVEYIVSEKLFDTLPEEEKGYWHPHNYEVLSGQLVAPGLPEVAEKELMRLLMNSYGKTWHTWHTGRHTGEPGQDLPLGDPMLMWSFNRDGEADPELERDREEHMRLDTSAKRANRSDLALEARPQRGVDALKGSFPHAAEPPEGVRDADDPCSPARTGG
ncbi:MAG: OBAP family protein [Rubrobacteraceae bacterium]